MDGDGDLDVIAAEATGGVSWYAWGGALWHEHPVTTVDASDVPQGVLGQDMDGDGDGDVLVAAHDLNTVAWHEVTSTVTGSTVSFSYTEHVISSSVTEAKSIAVGDVDGDGDVDVASTAKDSGLGNLAWHEQLSASWADHSVAPDLRNLRIPYLADMDGDSDLDLLQLCTSSSGGYVCRADSPLMNRGAAATRIFRGDESRPRRGRDADSPRS